MLVSLKFVSLGLKISLGKCVGTKFFVFPIHKERGSDDVVKKKIIASVKKVKYVKSKSKQPF